MAHLAGVEQFGVKRSSLLASPVRSQGSAPRLLIADTSCHKLGYDKFCGNRAGKRWLLGDDANDPFGHGDDAMDFYRLYVLGIDDQIIELIELRFPNDEAAIDYAERRVDGRSFELWQGDRRLR